MRRTKDEVKRIINSMFTEESYKKVVEEMRRRGWGTQYGPGSAGGYKPKGKKERGDR